MRASRPIRTTGSERLARVPVLRCLSISVVLTSLIGLGMPVAAGEIKPANIVVNTTSDVAAADGLCSLREAITASNTTSATGGCIAGTGSIDPDHISFALGAGVPTITIGSNLPTVTAPVLFFGATGSATRVRLLGPGAGIGLSLAATADASWISGLVIEGFQTGIDDDGASSVAITGNVLGPNVWFGIDSNGISTTIGGTVGVTPGGACTGTCNVISGNGLTGIVAQGSGAIVGNYIGTTAAGTAANANLNGVSAVNGPWTIGGFTPAAANVISGNTNTGVSLTVCSSCVVYGNRIGTNAAGTAAIPNATGVSVAGNGGSIGSFTAGSGNIISGNLQDGVRMSQVGFASVIGNRIGVSATGAAVGNGGNGVHVLAGAAGSQTTVIGSTGEGGANIIAFNGAAGVKLEDDAGAGSINKVPIRGNSIHSNAGAGIVLQGAVNGNISAPVISGLRPVHGSGACNGCLVDVYSDSAEEGRIFEGSATADSGGNWELPGLFAGPKVTAVATTVNLGSSEFSAPFTPTTPFTDIATSPFETEITWLYANGITTGCSATKYCPSGSVTRGQMASFLARMFGLPPTGTDFFTDDETSTHETDINRLAAAGITTGCGPSLFCPLGNVLRDQMASFIARAAGLTVGGGRDYFNDDDGNSHEVNIDRNAAAGITTGCGSYAYCPSGEVTREQMAAFLRRVLVPAMPPPYPAPP